MQYLDLLQKQVKLQEFFRRYIRDMNLTKSISRKELGDCLWMIAEACEALDLDMDDVMQTNIDKLKARYPEGFSADRSLHRKEGDILMLTKLALIFIIWGIYGDLEKKNDETSSFCMVLLTFLIIFS